VIIFGIFNKVSNSFDMFLTKILLYAKEISTQDYSRKIQNFKK